MTGGTSFFAPPDRNHSGKGIFCYEQKPEKSRHCRQLENEQNPQEATALLNEIAPLVKDAGCDVVACVPFIDLYAALEATKGTNIKIGAENCYWAESGAFTGEISAKMLADIGVPYVIIGHSERRTYFGDTDETVQKRTRGALDAGLNVILCVGEYLEQREQNG